MKKSIILVAVGLLSFVVGTAGIYFAMPAISPDTVDSTRVRLDSLGLMTMSPAAPAAPRVAEAIDTLPSDSTAGQDTTVAKTSIPNPQDIIQRLQDSLSISANLIQNLTADTSSLSLVIAELHDELEVVTAKQAEADGLSQSLVKLEDRQLGNVLAGLDLGVIELLYEQASPRDRTRLLQAMTPEQAARFVRTLVNGPEPAEEATTDAQTEPEEQADDGANQTAN